MGNYFDLNSRSKKAYEKELKSLSSLYESDTKVVTVLNKFPTKAESPVSPQLSNLEQFTMYFAVVLGVLFSSAIMNYVKNGEMNIVITFGGIIAACLVGLFIMPNVYEKMVFVGQPKLIQFAIFFQNGVLWQVIATALTAAA